MRHGECPDKSLGSGVPLAGRDVTSSHCPFEPVSSSVLWGFLVVPTERLMVKLNEIEPERLHCALPHYH